MAEIIPAVMPQNSEDLAAHLAQVNGLVPLVQIDVMDGHFVKDVSWPYTEGDGYFQSILQEDSGLPYWNEFDFEVDLMVAKPEQSIDDWITAGARRIIVHLESTNAMDKILEEFRERFPKRDTPDIFDVEIGVAINVATPLEEVEPFIDRADFIQLMGINTIGVQGEEFESKVVDKVHQLRQLHPGTIISVDGGVNFNNAGLLIAAGANRLVIGSAIFKSENIAEAVEEFKFLGTE